MFNIAENQDYEGPLPDDKYCSPETMMPSEREEFKKWCAANRGSMFKLKKGLAYFCRQDVKILREACDWFREQVLKMTECDIFTGLVGDIIEESEI